MALFAVKRALCVKNLCVCGQQLPRSNKGIKPILQTLWRGKMDARSVKVFDFLICEAGVVICPYRALAHQFVHFIEQAVVHACVGVFRPDG